LIVKRAALVVFGVACRKEPARVDLPAPLPISPAPTTTATLAPPPREALFPEDPSLDDTEPSGALFTQETWTGASQSQQHCREWGFDPSREADVRDRVNTILAERGLHLPDKARVKGLVVAMGSYATGVVDHGPRIKLAVCTEGVAPKSAHDTFAEHVLASPRAPRSREFAALGDPDVAWRRIHTTGEIEIGLRFPHAPEPAATRVHRRRHCRARHPLQRAHAWSGPLVDGAREAVVATSSD
jgi:hypothetical protein